MTATTRLRIQSITAIGGLDFLCLLAAHYQCQECDPIPLTLYGGQ
jgi:hypothetical protein